LEGDTVTAKATTFKKAQYHAAIVGACNEQYQKNPRSTKNAYHKAIVKAIDSTREQLASKLPGAHLPKNPGTGTLALQKLAQEERDREANRRELQTPIRMGGPSAASGISNEEREGRIRFQRFVEASQKHVSKKTAKKTKKFFTRSSASGISNEEREGRLRFQKFVEASQKHVSKKTAKKTKKFFTEGPGHFWKNL
jgi:hypothetical protein